MIHQLYRKIKRDELLMGGFVLFIMLNLFNVLNQVFHLVMARLLGPGDYAKLAVLFSIMYVFSIPSEAIQNIVASYISKLGNENKYGKIKFFLKKSFKKSARISILLFILYLPIALFLSYFLKINYLLFFITGIFIFLVFFIPLIRGVLQGQKRFGSLGLNMVIEGMIKVVLGITFVLIGFKVYGAIFALIASTGISFFLIFYVIKDIIRSEEIKENFSGIYSYSAPYFMSIISIVLMYSLDVILAKRFFDPVSAGNYAVVSALGKIILFSVYAISKAMLPLTSEGYKDNEKTSRLLKKSLMTASLISVCFLFIYLLIPSIIIQILYGKQYAIASNILFIIGISYTFLSFTNIILLYGLSINRIKKSSYSLFIFVIIEICLLSLFHKNLSQFSLGFLASNVLFFLYSLILLNFNRYDKPK
jgi:O-antigen/teichoic acid export membrane protein